ncbi:hypothetical protein DM860_000040 [Cuscuta australis]|uniref:Zinc-ribbon 15 domain-containing protein n=1 Tax=Cuscuta australis TaxID=267555 RepID=A0A328CWC9_9ASTE|nr:hypothetical protein DM860_000040 [Cuscuta australis]
MFFFFAGAIEQQVKQVLKSGAGRCIACGSRADLVDYEKVLKLFFVPVRRRPGDKPAMYCDNCKLFFPQTLAPPPPRSKHPDALSCRSCGREAEADFRFCPYCGAEM